MHFAYSVAGDMINPLPSMIKENVLSFILVVTLFYFNDWTSRKHITSWVWHVTTFAVWENKMITDVMFRHNSSDKIYVYGKLNM